MLVDLRLGNEYDIVELKRLAFAASLCIRTASTWRPSMNEVLLLVVSLMHALIGLLTEMVAGGGADGGWGDTADLLDNDRRKRRRRRLSWL